ncbi:MAG: hypothetical protein J6B62_02675, partial [Bacteroidales bacterium]|nr:hypothetical protein [Bacteroidales bacterium]
MKRTITLEAIDPIEIYGAGNRILEALCTYFPELKVVARGNEILLDGKQEDIASFDGRISQLIERRLHKRNITPYDVEEMFEGSGQPERYMPAGDMVIVYGNDGKPIKARNRTQE